jgi:hypothetical protein
MRGLPTVPQTVSISKVQNAPQASGDYAARMLALEDRIAAAESNGALIRSNLSRIPREGFVTTGQMAQRAELESQLVANDAKVASLKRLIQDARAEGGFKYVAQGGAGAASAKISGTTVQPEFLHISKEAMVISSMFTVFVLGPIAIAFAIRLVRRGWSTPAAPQISEMNERVRRIETAVDSMAIEVERVSESQRYLVRTLNDSAPSLPGQKG